MGDKALELLKSLEWPAGYNPVKICENLIMPGVRMNTGAKLYTVYLETDTEMFSVTVQEILD